MTRAYNVARTVAKRTPTLNSDQRICRALVAMSYIKCSWTIPHPSTFQVQLIAVESSHRTSGWTLWWHGGRPSTAVHSFCKVFLKNFHRNKRPKFSILSISTPVTFLERCNTSRLTDGGTFSSFYTCRVFFTFWKRKTKKEDSNRQQRRSKTQWI